MSGRHGKLSGSPFHVITKRNLAAEKYGCRFYECLPECSYRHNNICTLPQNKNSYGKLCGHHKCKYIHTSNENLVNRHECIYSYKNICLYNSNLNNCTQKNDMSYCCDYFIPIKGNEELSKKIKNKTKCYELIKHINELKKSRSNKTDPQKYNNLTELIESHKKKLESNPELKEIISSELSKKIDSKYGLETQDIPLLNRYKIYTYSDFIKIDPDCFEVYTYKNGKLLKETVVKRLIKSQKNIRKRLRNHYSL